MNKNTPHQTLKALCKSRFINEVLTPALASSDGKGLVLILDNHTSHIINNIISASELISSGVSCIFKIENPRKTFNYIPGYYFIVPSKTNINILQEDFNASPSKYKTQHLYFSRKISDEIFQYIASKSFAKKIATIMEFNMDFFSVGDAVFQIVPKSPLEVQADTLVSVIASLLNVSSVELFALKKPIYTQGRQICKAIDLGIKALMPHIQNSTGGLKIKLFVFERNADLVTPLMHDFHYESILADFLGDSVQIYTNISGSDEISEKDKKIEDDDKLYRKYRYGFISEMMNELPNDLSAFKKENPTAFVQSKESSEIGISQMASAMKGLNEYNEFMKFYTFNLENAGKIVEISKAEERQTLSDLEQTVATAIDESNTKIDAKFRADEVKKYLESNAKEELKLRLALIALGTLYINVNYLRESLAPSSQIDFDSFAQLVGKYGTVVPEESKNVYRKIIKERLEKTNSSLQRYVSRIDHLIWKCVFDGVNDEFERISYEGPKSKESQKVIGIGPKNSLFKLNSGPTQSKNLKEDTLVIVFFLGGVSYAEIGALMRMEKESDGRVRVIVGGNRIFNAKEFIEEYLNKAAID
jgi:hypothetical protein